VVVVGTAGSSNGAHRASDLTPALASSAQECRSGEGSARGASKLTMTFDEAWEAVVEFMMRETHSFSLEEVPRLIDAFDCVGAILPEIRSRIAEAPFARA
jgi:hypothetical protein